MLNSSMPRTSPTCQSRLGLSGWLLWQLTQAAPMMIGVAKRTRRTVLEGIVREKAELRVAVVSVDQFAEFEREGSWDRNGAGDFRVIGEHVRLLAVSEHAADHVAGVIVPDAVDRRRQLVGLLGQRALRQVAQVEPDRNRQSGENEQHEDDGDEKPARDISADSLAEGGRALGGRRRIVWRLCGIWRSCDHLGLAFEFFSVMPRDGT